MPDQLLLTDDNVAPLLRDRLSQLRSARDWSYGDVAQLVGIDADAVARCEKDPLSSSPSTLGRLLHYYGVSLVDLLAPDWKPHPQPLLRSRREVSNDPAVGAFIARGLYVARTWKWLYDELAKREALPPREYGPLPSDFGKADIDALRVRLSNCQEDPRTAAQRVREFFEYSDSVRFHIRERSFNLGLVMVALRFPKEAPFDGCYQRDCDGTPVALLNLTHRPPRHIEMVAAHELYHFIFEDVPFEFNGRNAIDRPEAERHADEFADHLLVPESGLRKLAVLLKEDPSSHQKFIVSVDAKYKASRAVLIRQCLRTGLLSEDDARAACDRERLYHPVALDRGTAPRLELPRILEEILESAVKEGIATETLRSDMLAMMRDE